MEPTAALRLCVRRRRLPGPSGSTVEVNLRVPSDVGCIEEVVDLILRHCCSGTWSSRRLRFNLRVAIAEALANAIVDALAPLGVTEFSGPATPFRVWQAMQHVSRSRHE